ncbi:MAG: DNA circularization N-terminal domain-containing protein [Oscillospiraceae bacterium]|nr:DNA circularization N-terminal domain-containing protein [Oscillospiraceae bacterium]
MDYLSYKTFVWPQNPHTYKEECRREAQYHTENGVAYFDGMGAMQRIITGSGAFYGEDAFTEFKKLMKLAEDGTAGNLEHPVWGIRYCYLTKLVLTQEPRNDYVSYQFEFTQAAANGEVPK